MNQEAKVVLPENLNHYIADYLRRKIFVVIRTERGTR